MAAEKKKGSLIGGLVPILVLTVAAGGGGALIGKQIAAAARAEIEKSAAGPGGAKPGAAKPGSPETGGRSLKELLPVVTNLASPEGASIRLQAAIVFDKSNAAGMDVIATKVGEDILVYLRTLTLPDIQGASGLQALRDDLSERAALRSDGKVREVLIEMLVVK